MINQSMEWGTPFSDKATNGEIIKITNGPFCLFSILSFLGSRSLLDLFWNWGLYILKILGSHFVEGHIDHLTQAHAAS